MWLLEYSKEQKQLHILNEKDRPKSHYGHNELSCNGYTVVSVCKSYEEASEKLEKFTILAEDDPEYINRFVDSINELDSDILSAIMDYKTKRNK